MSSRGLNTSAQGIFDELRRVNIDNLTVSHAGSITSLSANRPRISEVRRTFLITGLFDVILSFLLWVIFSQISYQSLKVAFSNEIANYTFQKSAFDTVMLSVGRCLVLEIAYGALVARTVWYVVITTIGSSIFLLVKVFFYDFSTVANPNALNYFIFLVAFTLSWVELWMLDFKVLRTERKEVERIALDERIRLISTLQTPNYATILQTREGSINNDLTLLRRGRDGITQHLMAYTGGERRRLPGNRSEADQSEYYSVASPELHSDEEMEDDDQPLIDTRPEPISPTPHVEVVATVPVTLASPDTAAQLSESVRLRYDQFRILAQRTVDRMWQLYTDGVEWKIEADAAADMGTSNATPCLVDSRVFEKRRYFRLRTILDAPLRVIVEEMFNRIESSVSWNASLKFARRIEMFDPHTDVLYTVSNDAIGGLVSSREFLSLRYVTTKKKPSSAADVSVVIDTPVDHPLVPAMKKYVRGENGPSAMFFCSVEGSNADERASQRTEMTWLFYCDVKGWVPRSAVEANMAKTMLTVVESLRYHLAINGRSTSISNQTNPNPPPVAST